MYFTIEKNIFKNGKSRECKGWGDEFSERPKAAEKNQQCLVMIVIDRNCESKLAENLIASKFRL